MPTATKDGSAPSPAREVLTRRESGAGPHPLFPLDHLAFAIILDCGDEPMAALAALAKLRQEYVDWNEVRVARIQELARTLDSLVGAERCAKRIKDEYNAFFDKKGALDFEFLGAGKPAETRRLLGQLLPNLGKGAVSLLLFEFCAGASLPISDEGLKVARKDGVIGKAGDRGQLARTLAEGLKPGEAARLLQYWELEASGSPYFEMPKREGAKPGAKAKKTSGKIKAKAAAKSDD